MDALLRDLLDELVAALPSAVGQPQPAATPIDRRGWFHASDVNHGGSLRFDSQRCVARYLGQPAPSPVTPEAALAIGLGCGVDRLFEAALGLCRSVASTQADLRDEALRLRGTPDFLWQPWGDLLPGEVKSCGPRTFARFWANPDWPVARAYFYRQLQAYLLLTGADRGVLLLVNRAGCELGAELRDCLAARWVCADAAMVIGTEKLTT